MTIEVTEAGVKVSTRGEDLRDAANDVVERAVGEGIPAALMRKDTSLWGEDAAAEAAIRLGWLDLPSESRQLLAELQKLTETARDAGLDHVVLAGMGGSSLAPEVIARTFGAELTVLDTTDPHQVRRALSDRIERTIVVVSSKSGTTIETDSHRRVYEQAFRDAGLRDEEIAARFVVVTDSGSELEEVARHAGYRVIQANPHVGGRYSALSAFGLVPAALAGVEVTRLLDEAEAIVPALSYDEENPGLALGGALSGAALAGRDKVVLADTGSGIVGFGDWAEQLLAESTGKEESGLLPVVVENIDAPGTTPMPDSHLVALGPPAGGAGTIVAGPLGAQFLVWEYATAIVGWTLGINPFDQPNVTESKDNTKALLERGELPASEPVLVDGAVEIYTDPELVSEAHDLQAVLDMLLSSLASEGYLAVMAYLDRLGEAPAAELRTKLAARVAQPVTFGWGPRFLHSTGQYHKGGPQTGAFLQITGEVTDDILVPDKPYTLGRLQLAQALGDLDALTGRGRPVVRLHLRNRTEGLQQLLTAAGGRT